MLPLISSKLGTFLTTIFRPIGELGTRTFTLIVGTITLLKVGKSSIVVPKKIVFQSSLIEIRFVATIVIEVVRVIILTTKRKSWFMTLGWSPIIVTSNSCFFKFIHEFNVVRILVFIFNFFPSSTRKKIYRTTVIRYKTKFQSINRCR